MSARHEEVISQVVTVEGSMLVTASKDLDSEDSSDEEDFGDDSSNDRDGAKTVPYQSDEEDELEFFGGGNEYSNIYSNFPKKLLFEIDRVKSCKSRQKLMFPDAPNDVSSHVSVENVGSTEDGDKLFFDRLKCSFNGSSGRFWTCDNLPKCTSQIKFRRNKTTRSIFRS